MASEKIYCPIRQEWVAALPEEYVRQSLITKMIRQLGFPVGLMGVERELSLMPHLSQAKMIPDRRIDIVCFGQGIHPAHALYPLLVIECKAVNLSTKVINQVTGYNHFLGAYFIAVANQHEIKFGWQNALKKEYAFIDFIPTYQDLLKSCQGLLNPLNK
ncbi:type I restriction enzyme HsdR N-terminal domain-containing protein [Parachlamydia acanthamoebae]|uniref:type I restriction enzyme HsdR N-terminal domain-containing protein n=1 Tax=Parachlamydia acanthamoebae TaxID=83552 RepID=UPI0001C176B7|nr:type I restriction enzyme HsdR N-terminal domain-containing protein [Parachlamydia acanthamoebae]EFB41604.1 hypothetical protein pah_c026o031 [Parachlamydia acanthamoebae str. Hall's coccus]